MKAWVLVLAVVTSSLAHAQPRWAQGVTRERQDRAEALWEAANRLVLARDYAPAVEKYRAAIEAWDHPKIQLNLAMALISLERYLEASDALEHALRFAEAPFSPDDYREALNYQKLLASKIGVIDVTCSQAGARISLDGKPWFSCPGQQQRRVLASEHVIIAERAGSLTITRPLAVFGGRTVRENIQLAPLDALPVRYRMRRWIPWTLAGAGVAAGVAGLAVWNDANRDMEDVRSWFQRACPAGCEIETQPGLVVARDSARRRGTIGIAAMATGSVVALGGLALVLWNRPVRVAPAAELTGDRGVVASVSGRF